MSADKKEGSGMRAIMIGAGMGGLCSALALRESGAFDTIDVFEQTSEPSTAGAGLNIAPNGARICKWLGIDLVGGRPKGKHRAIGGGRAAILENTKQIMPDGTVSARKLDHKTAGGDDASLQPMQLL